MGAVPLRMQVTKGHDFILYEKAKLRKNIFIFIVCCDDKVHCCPKDAVCDSKAGKCSSVSLEIYSLFYMYRPILTFLLFVLYFVENVIIEISILEKQECHLPRWRFSMS